MFIATLARCQKKLVLRGRVGHATRCLARPGQALLHFINVEIQNSNGVAAGSAVWREFDLKCREQSQSSVA